MLNMLDEFTHECLTIRIARTLRAIDVIDVLSDLFFLRGLPGHIRSDNGPEFVAKAVQEWTAAVGTKTAYIERGSPWENGYIESFNARHVPLEEWFRGELKTLFEERVSHSPVFLAEIFDLKPLRGWWERHQAGEDLNRFPWALLVLESWGQQFIAGTNTGAAA
jgi:transposase InsO family protein